MELGRWVFEPRPGVRHLTRNFQTRSGTLCGRGAVCKNRWIGRFWSNFLFRNFSSGGARRRKAWRQERGARKRFLNRPGDFAIRNIGRGFLLSNRNGKESKGDDLWLRAVPC